MKPWLSYGTTVIAIKCPRGYRVGRILGFDAAGERVATYVGGEPVPAPIALENAKRFALDLVQDQERFPGVIPRERKSKHF